MRRGKALPARRFAPTTLYTVSVGGQDILFRSPGFWTLERRRFHGRLDVFGVLEKARYIRVIVW